MSAGSPPLRETCFFSADWGTSHLRLRLVELATGRILGEVRSDEGVGRIASLTAKASRPEAFRATLAHQVLELSGVASARSDPGIVVISGMASSSIGWRELAYASVPLALDASTLLWDELEPIEVQSRPHRVLLLSGARTEVEIMRGEETQVLGLARLLQEPLRSREGVVVLPGTHSKHVHIAMGAVRGFQTYMTGELFQLLREHSVLRHSVQGGDRSPGDLYATSPEAQDAFKDGVQAGSLQPLSTALFRVRTRHVLDGCPAPENDAYLSGLLIGSELAALQIGYSPEIPIILCGGEQLTECYQTAFDVLELGKRLQVVPASDAQRLTSLGQAAFLEWWLARTPANPP